MYPARPPGGPYWASYPRLDAALNAWTVHPPTYHDLFTDQNLNMYEALPAWNHILDEQSKSGDPNMFVFGPRAGSDTLSINSVVGLRLMLISCKNINQLITIVFKKAEFSEPAFLDLSHVVPLVPLIADIEFKYCKLSDQQLAMLSHPGMKAKVSTLGITQMNTTTTAQGVFNILAQNPTFQWLSLKDSTLTLPMVNILEQGLRGIQPIKLLFSRVTIASDALPKLVAAIAAQKKLDILFLKDMRLKNTITVASNLAEWKPALTNSLQEISLAHNRNVNDQNVLDRLEHTQVSSLVLDHTGIVHGSTISALISKHPTLRNIFLQGCAIEPHSLAECIRQTKRAPGEEPVTLCFTGEESCFAGEGGVNVIGECLRSESIRVSIKQQDKRNQLYEAYRVVEARKIEKKIRESAHLTQELVDAVYNGESSIVHSVCKAGVLALLRKAGLTIKSITSEQEDSLFDSIALLIEDNSWAINSAHLKLRLLAEVYTNQDPNAYRSSNSKHLLALPLLAQLLERPITVFDTINPVTVADGKLQPHKSLLYTPTEAKYPTIRLFRSLDDLRVKYHPVVELREQT